MACWLAAGQLKLVSWHEQQFFISCPKRVTQMWDVPSGCEVARA